MQTTQIIASIKRMSLSEKLSIMEHIFRDIQQEASEEKSEDDKRKKAAELLLKDYQTNDELTAFLVLDNEDFYEAR